MKTNEERLASIYRKAERLRRQRQSRRRRLVIALTAAAAAAATALFLLLPTMLGRAPGRTKLAESLADNQAPGEAGERALKPKKADSDTYILMSRADKTGPAAAAEAGSAEAGSQAKLPKTEEHADTSSRDKGSSGTQAPMSAMSAAGQALKFKDFTLRDEGSAPYPYTDERPQVLKRDYTCRARSGVQLTLYESPRPLPADHTGSGRPAEINGLRLKIYQRENRGLLLTSACRDNYYALETAGLSEEEAMDIFFAMLQQGPAARGGR